MVFYLSWWRPANLTFFRTYWLVFNEMEAMSVYQVKLFLCQRFLLFHYICIDAGYVRSIPWSKSSAKVSFKVEWESGWSNWAMIRKFSTFDDVLLQRSSWPFYCVTCSLFTDPIFSLKEPLRYRMKNRGGFIDRESMRQGARVGTEENVLSFSFSPSALTDCRKGKKKTSVYRLPTMVHNSHKNYSLRSRFTQVPC